jgi:predicted NUDIX family NTP pyrophosphohydrolase
MAERIGQVREFPELDRVAWLDLDSAQDKIVAAPATFLDRLAAYLRD